MAVPRRFVRIPRQKAAAPPRRGAPRAIAAALRLASHARYLALARARGGPGLGMRMRAASMGIRLLLARGLQDLLAWELLLFPMDSVRYFELDFAWSAAAPERGPLKYLDVSSPRLFPLAFLRHRARATADLLNPDGRDLELTRTLAQALHLSARCSFVPQTIDAAPLRPEHYDLVTSISVLEHISAPAGAAAVGRLWECLSPGGTLIVTVPCASQAHDEYLDLDEYGLQRAGADGFYFGQHVFDERSLEDGFFRVCGAPRRIEVFGEIRPGTFDEDRARKNSGLALLEREPLAMATEYRRFGSVSELPGVGVVGMAFRKASRTGS